MVGGETSECGEDVVVEGGVAVIMVVLVCVFNTDSALREILVSRAMLGSMAELIYDESFDSLAGALTKRRRIS